MNQTGDRGYIGFIIPPGLRQRKENLKKRGRESTKWVKRDGSFRVKGTIYEMAHLMYHKMVWMVEAGGWTQLGWKSEVGIPSSTIR